MTGDGAGRRLTPDEEARGARLFSQGLSTRAVATQLGIGNATAARLKQRLAERAAAQHSEQTTVTDSGPDMTVTELPAAGPGGELAELERQRDELAAIVATHEARRGEPRGGDSAGVRAPRRAGRRPGRPAIALQAQGR